MRLKVWEIASGVALAQLWIGCVLVPRPTLAQAVSKQPQPVASPLHSTIVLPLIAEDVPTQVPKPQPPAPAKSLGRDLLREVVQCVLAKAINPQSMNPDALNAVSLECMYSVVLLDADGKIRPDANERMMALVKATGYRQPKPASQGQATLQLQQLKGFSLFTVPVTLAGQSETFLLDTGATTSIVDAQIASQLNLKGNPLPKGFLKNFVVGDNCSEVTATMHSFPSISVGSATVNGITGLGLPRTSIPGNVAGVLGIDFLGSFDIILDPKTSQLQLLPPSLTPLLSQAIPLVGKFGLMTTQVYINGKGPFTFAIDTGAESMVLSDRLAKHLAIETQNAEKVDVTGFCGTETGKQVKLTELRMQNYRLSELSAVVIDNDLLDVAGVEGIVGQNFLNRYSQHWRFGAADALGFPEKGSLTLTPL
ncbi:MAG: retroviral-like aspartic protease family protein [Scytolyngbya sp. HA4215-MV1]|jgi:predicted aspartyl protease|nr:retroviral-like aspartic protease family protein [Scytolyngbya sp. HA4215-MV1]